MQFYKWLFIFEFRQGPLLKVEKQTLIAASSAEADYVALSAAVQQAVWLWQMFLFAKFLLRSFTFCYSDRQSVCNKAGLKWCKWKWDEGHRWRVPYCSSLCTCKRRRCWFPPIPRNEGLCSKKNAPEDLVWALSKVSCPRPSPKYVILSTDDKGGELESMDVSSLPVIRNHKFCYAHNYFFK